MACSNGNYTGKCDLKTELDSVSYSMGSLEGAGIAEMSKRHPFDTIDVKKMISAFGMANGFSQEYKKVRFEQFDTLDFKAFMYGFCHGAKGNVQIDQAEANMVLNNKFDAVRAMRLAKQAEEAQANVEAGKAYMADYAKQDGVDSLESGILYKILVKGNGAVPATGSTVKVNYEGKLINGEVFDSSYDREEPLTCNTASGLISGWLKVLQVMPVGSKWEVVIPSELAYGNQDTGKIKAGSTLIFTIELLEIVK